MERDADESLQAELWVVGEVFEDLVFHGLDQLPELGREIKTERFTRTLGGGALITSVAASRLGLNVFVTAHMPDEAARLLEIEQIPHQNVRFDDEPHAVTVALSTATERAYITYDGASEKLAHRVIDLEPTTIAEPVRARHCHLALAPVEPLRWAAWIDALRESGVHTSASFGWDPSLLETDGFDELVRSLDLVCFNRAEAELYAGAPDFETARAYWQSHPGVVVITLGEDGASWLGASGSGHAEGVSAAALDTVGAGDGFNAGYLAARIRGFSIAEAAAMGNRVGARSTTQVGGLAGLEGDLTILWPGGQEDAS